MRKATIFVGDFETTLNRKQTRVWAWGLMGLEDGQFVCGDDIGGMFDYLENWPSVKVFFHNLKFDGQFVLHYLFSAGYVFRRRKIVTDTGARETITLAPGEFTTLISDLNEWYSVEVRTYSGVRIVFWDSLNLIPLKVEQIPDAFGLEVNKLHIDYEKDRPAGSGMTGDEIDYLRNDCRIVRDALLELYGQGLTRMTTAGNALEDYKRRIGRRQFDRWFPAPYYDAEIRRAYRGGFCYVNPVYQGKDIGRGIVLDVNGLYSYILYGLPMPYGEEKSLRVNIYPMQIIPCIRNVCAAYLILKWAKSQRSRSKINFRASVQRSTCIAAEGTRWI